MIKPVSSSCNMRCRYCFYADVSERRQHPSFGKMSEQTLESLIRKAMRYADRQVTFAFQGGEPTLAGVGFYRRLIELQRSYNTRGLAVQNSIQTNGYMLDDELLELLARERFLVGVSFDGTPGLHDKMRVDAQGRPTSAEIERTISRLQAAGVDFNILCVVNRHVAEHPGEVFDYLKQYGFIQYISCLDPFDGSTSEHSLTPELYAEFLKESFDLYYRQFKRGHFVSVRNFDNYLTIIAGYEPENCGMCGRCARYFLIEADGGVYPCDFYVLDNWRMGNINEDSFFKLIKSPVGGQFERDSLYIDHACRSCRWYPLCRGGCRRDREPFADGLPLLNKWCASYRALFEHAYPRMAEMAQALTRR